MEVQTIIIFAIVKILAESILSKEQLYDRSSDDVFVFLRGGLLSNSNDPIAQPGDVLDGATLNRLSRVFEITDEIVLLSIAPAGGGVENGRP